MPLFDYRCLQCGAVYDVFHKMREVAEDVACPECTSPNALKLFSVPNIGIPGKVPSLSNSGCSCTSGRGEACGSGECDC